MAPRAEETDPVPVRTDRVVQHAGVARAVNGDEGVDLGSAVAKEVFHPPKVPDPLFADGTDEQHIVRGVRGRGGP